jgi:Protein of unknown function (DUF1571)
MIRLARPTATGVRQGLRNVAAVAITAAAAGFLYLRFDPVPAGLGSEAADLDVARLAAELDQPASSSRPAMLETAFSAVESPVAREPAAAVPLDGHAALQHDLERLQRAEQRLLEVEDYTATFYRRERTGHVLAEPDIAQLKVRHRPFSFYMKWLNGDEGREILYVEGRYGGEMVVKLGGLRGRLLPTLYINPHGAVALRECRHPATEVGLLHMTRRMIGYRRRDVSQPGGMTCHVQTDCEFQNRLCDVVTIEYDRPELSPDYRKTLHYFDRATELPVLVKSYGWPDAIPDVDPARLDETTLVEQYAYTNLRLNAGLVDREFDRDNPRYSFSR